MPLIGVTVDAGLSVSSGLTATPSAPTAGTPSAPSGPSTPSVTAGPARNLHMATGETVYLNVRLGGPPTAWVAYQVAYTFADGNAVLVKEPDCVAYTGDLSVGANLRRKGVDYGDATFAP